MKEMDCLGDMCPVPLMKLQQCDDLQNSGDSVRLVTDHSCTCESVQNYCRQKGCSAGWWSPCPAFGSWKSQSPSKCCASPYSQST